MSDFHFIQMPPDGTGKKSAATGSVEIKYSSGTQAFSLGDTVTTDSGMVGNVIKLEGTVGTGEIYLRLNHGSITSISAGEALKVETVTYALSSENSEDFYSQEVVITGGNNAFNSVNVSDQGALITSFPSGDVVFDAFGKLQTSESTTIREYQPTVDSMPDEFTHIIVNDASVTWNSTRHLVELFTGTASGDKVTRRSNLYHKYQTGVATTAIFSLFIDGGKTGCVRRTGLFDEDDGVFFHAIDTAIGVTVRSSVTGSVEETTVLQEDWNVDRLDGTGGSFNVSRVLINPTKIQVMFIDFQWLGGGRVRFGFVIDGSYIVCHEFYFANNISNPYMRTGTLPFCIEQENIGATASPSYLYSISASVKCEGKFTPREWTQGGTSEPHELIADGSGLTIDIAETVVDGILTDAEVSIDSGGTNYVVGDTVTVTGGNADAIIEVTSVASGVVDGITVTDGGTGYSDASAVVTTYNRRYKPLVAIRAAKLLSGVDNRAVSLPITLHITDINGGTDPYQIEFVKNDTLNAGVNWLDPYPNNALESTNPTVGDLLTSDDGEVIMTHVSQGHEDFDLEQVFGLQSQLIIRKADINAEPDHYTVRVKPVKPTGSVELIAGFVWKEYR